MLHSPLSSTFLHEWNIIFILVRSFYAIIVKQGNLQPQNRIWGSDKFAPPHPQKLEAVSWVREKLLIKIRRNMRYCDDDQHKFTKMVLKNQTMYICQTCSYVKGYVHA